MIKVDFLPGEDVHNAAKWLVAHAPATTTFNGVELQVDSTDSSPDDVVRQYWRGMAAQWPNNAEYYNRRASEFVTYPKFSGNDPVILP